MPEATMQLPRDEFSSRLRELSGDDHAVRRDSTIDLEDDYGNLTTWRVTTFRSSKGDETIFLQRQTSAGGDRWVLPPAVTAAIIRQRASATSVNRRRGAAAGAATRAAKGIRPAFGRKGGAHAKA